MSKPRSSQNKSDKSGQKPNKKDSFFRKLFSKKKKKPGDEQPKSGVEKSKDREASPLRKSRSKSGDRSPRRQSVRRKSDHWERRRSVTKEVPVLSGETQALQQSIGGLLTTICCEGLKAQFSGSRNIVLMPVILIQGLGVLELAADGQVKTEIEAFFNKNPTRLSLQQLILMINDLYINRKTNAFRTTGAVQIFSKRTDFAPEFQNIIQKHYKVKTSSLTDGIADINSELTKTGYYGDMSESFEYKIGADNSCLFMLSGQFETFWPTPFQLFEYREFRLSEKETCTVEMMRQQGSHYYQLSLQSGFHAVILGLTLGHQSGYRIFFIQPLEWSMDHLIATLDPDRLRATLNATARWTLDVAIPRFKITSTVSLRDYLRTSKLGSMLHNNELKFFGGEKEDGSVSDFVHHVSFKVGGKGFEEIRHESTKAKEKARRRMSLGVHSSASTTMTRRGNVVTPEKMVIDRPFLVIVQHRMSNVIVLAGVILDPRE